MAVALVGMGGNLGAVANAFAASLASMPSRGLQVQRVARLFRTRALVEPGAAEDSRDYWNSAVAVQTEQSPRVLLDRLLMLEREHGRERNGRWQPRTLDLDLLLYDNQVVNEPGLTIPHPALSERLFVLRPLADIAPNQSVPPGNFTVAALLAQHADPNDGILEVCSWPVSLRVA